MSIAPPAGSTFNLANFEFIPDAVHGAIYFRGVERWEKFPAGVAGQVLKTNGPGFDPNWLTVPGGGDMLRTTYDPLLEAGDAFDLANMRISLETQGDVLIRGALGWERLPASTAGRVLTTNGGGSSASFADPSGDMLAATFDPGGVADDAFDFANMFITGEATGDILTRGSGGDWERIPVPGTAGRTIVSGAGTVAPTWELAPLSTGHVNGAQLTRPTAATVSIAAGQVRDDVDETNIRWASPLTVDLTASGAGGLDTGSEAASTWYDVYAIEGTSAPAGLFVVSGGAPVLPVGYTQKRLIGKVRNDGSSNLIDFSQQGSGTSRIYLWLSSESSRAVLTAGAAGAPTSVDCSTLCPPSTDHIILTAKNISSTQPLSLYQTTGGAVLETFATSAGGGSSPVTRELHFPVSSQAIAYSYPAAGGDADIFVRGFVEDL
jgi:hypothetical protein